MKLREGSLSLCALLSLSYFKDPCIIMAIMSSADLGEHPLGGLEEGEGCAAAQEARLGEIFEEL